MRDFCFNYVIQIYRNFFRSDNHTKRNYLDIHKRYTSTPLPQTEKGATRATFCISLHTLGVDNK